MIQDGAHSLGLRWRGLPMSHWSRFTMYSFQAIKHICANMMLQLESAKSVAYSAVRTDLDDVLEMEMSYLVQLT